VAQLFVFKISNEQS